MTFDRQALGKRGEQLAVRHLRRQGYRIRGKNVKTPFGEIDLLARQGEFLVLVEVKTRRTETFGSALEAVGLRKQKKLMQIASYLLSHLPPEDRGRPFRFDAVAVTFFEGSKRPQVEVVQNAFEARGAYRRYGV